MKRTCKDIDITDTVTIYPWVLDCLAKHRKRYDFRRFLLTTGGMTVAEYDACLSDKRLLMGPAHRVAQEAARQISEKRLDMTPIRMQERTDRSSHKVRLIGCEGPMQQVLDHIAVRSAWDVFRRRIVPQQPSSVAGRGPSYGVRMIRRWVTKDNAAMASAKAHRRRYTWRCKYHVKLDISKCYPSMRSDVFMTLFRRDCGNPDICWLWDELLRSHHIDGYTGMMIGALPSQWAAQLIMSYLYRSVTGRPGVSHCMMYMDDILLIGPSRGGLLRAVRHLIGYAARFGLSVKPGWHILRLKDTPIDIMGYVIHRSGAVTVRPRIFLRARRAALRAARNGLSLRQARRLVAYKGYFYQRRLRLDRVRADRKYHLTQLFSLAASLVAKEDYKCKSLTQTAS